eukprot:s523_g26.t1
MNTATATPPFLSDDENADMLDPSPAAGVILAFRSRTTVGQIALNLFELDYEIPGLLRFSDIGSTIIPATTTVGSMTYPRMLYIQVGAYSEYKRAAEVYETFHHVADADRATQAANDQLHVRIFMHFVSPFRCLDQQSRHLSMMEAVCDRLRTRLERVEYAYAHGVPLQLSPRPTAAATAWDDEAYVPPEALHPLPALGPEVDDNQTLEPAVHANIGPLPDQPESDPSMTPASSSNA